MDAFFALLGIVSICLSSAGCVLFALWTHHVRQMKDRRLRQEEVDRMFLLSEQMIEKGLMPPMMRNYERRLG